MVTMDKGLPERLEGGTHPRTQFQRTKIKGGRYSDHTRRQEKQLVHQDCPSAFVWTRRYHYSI